MYDIPLAVCFLILVSVLQSMFRSLRDVARRRLKPTPKEDK